jgi:hypothetical protein
VLELVHQQGWMEFYGLPVSTCQLYTMASKAEAIQIHTDRLLETMHISEVERLEHRVYQKRYLEYAETKGDTHTCYPAGNYRRVSLQEEQIGRQGREEHATECGSGMYGKRYAGRGLEEFRIGCCMTKTIMQ